MILIISTILLFLISIFISIKIGRRIESKKIKAILNKGTGRFGIIEYRPNYTTFYLEVEEIESAGDLTKIRIIDCKIPKGSSESKSNLLNDAHVNEWVKTVGITWYNSNSQKIRDEKLKSILEN